MRKVKKKEKLKQREKEKKRRERGKERKEKEENETVTVKRRCEGFVSVEAFEIFSQGEDLESCGDVWGDPLDKPEDLSDCELASCELVRAVLDGRDVTDVPVSPSSVITELCDVSPCRSGWEFVEPQSFSFSKKRAHCRADTRPTLAQNSYTSLVRDHGRYEVEGRGWNARE